MKQRILSPAHGYQELDLFFQEKGIRSILLVCGKSMAKLELDAYFQSLPQRMGIQVTRFSRFQPNPRYESACEGVQVFRQAGCDCIAAVGGGSAMDVAKCIKLFAPLDPSRPYLQQELQDTALSLVAIPTTAGTGSEATHFAVIYENGVKKSVAHESCVPNAVVFDPCVLNHVPDYHRKATMLDALCHAVEAFWSICSDSDSKEYSKQALRLIFKHWDGYLENQPEDNAGMQQAAYLAGKAINLAKTTAGHAMSYKMTSLYGIAHGHAAALCLIHLWPYMLEHMDLCMDPRGVNYLAGVFSDLAEILHGSDPRTAANWLRTKIQSLGLEVPIPSQQDFDLLAESVDPLRLGNHPVALDADAIRTLYHRILSGQSY